MTNCVSQKTNQCIFCFISLDNKQIIYFVLQSDGLGHLRSDLGCQFLNTVYIYFTTKHYMQYALIQLFHSK